MRYFITCLLVGSISAIAFAGTDTTKGSPKAPQSGGFDNTQQAPSVPDNGATVEPYGKNATDPVELASGAPNLGSSVKLSIENRSPEQWTGMLFISNIPADYESRFGYVYVDFTAPFAFVGPLWSVASDSSLTVDIPIDLEEDAAGLELYLQAFGQIEGFPTGYSLTNALKWTIR